MDEIVAARSGQEETIGILASGKVHDARGVTGAVQTLGERPSGFLTRLVVVLIENNVDLAIRGIAKLIPLQGRQMSADRAGRVANAFLPEKGQVEHALDQNDVGEVADRVPGEQSAL